MLLCFNVQHNGDKLQRLVQQFDVIQILIRHRFVLVIVLIIKDGIHPEETLQFLQFLSPKVLLGMHKVLDNSTDVVLHVLGLVKADQQHLEGAQEFGHYFFVDFLLLLFTFAQHQLTVFAPKSFGKAIEEDAKITQRLLHLA